MRSSAIPLNTHAIPVRTPTRSLPGTRTRAHAAQTRSQPSGGAYARSLPSSGCRSALRSVAVDGVTPPLALDPFAIATRTASDIGADRSRCRSGSSRSPGGPPLSYYHNTGDERRWLAAHVPHVHTPMGFTSRGVPATTRLDRIGSKAVTARGRRRVIATARQHRAVDCSSTSLDAVTTARLLVDLAGAGAPLVATSCTRRGRPTPRPGSRRLDRGLRGRGAGGPATAGTPLRRAAATRASPALGVREPGRARSRPRSRRVGLAEPCRS